MREEPAVFKTWMALLAACDADGLARVSVTYLSAVCYLPLDEVVAALARLEEPDPHSRSTNDEGRRIRRVDGGFELLNYTKYRERTYSMTPDAERMRRYRERKRNERNAFRTFSNVRNVSTS